MRKSLLGLVLVAALLPMTAVQAAPAGAVGKAAAAYSAETKNAKEAIAAGVAAGLTVEEAMAELLDADPANASAIVNAAVAAAPARAGAITAFAVSKGVPPAVAAQAAIAAAPQQANSINQAAGLSNTGSTSLLGASSGTTSGITIAGSNTGSTGGGGGGAGSTSPN
jgi:hypothetical protein